MSPLFAPFEPVKSIAHAGMDGLIVVFDGEDVLTMNRHVSDYFQTIQANPPSWLKNSLPAYDSLLILFDPAKIDDHGVYRYLSELTILGNSSEKEVTTHKMPVWYGGGDITDLPRVAEYTGLGEEEVIRLHTQTSYRVYAVGFAPGFAYLGDSPVTLSIPRLDTPRKRVPKGAVALADQQSAIYPQPSPGGWNVIGLCPLALFDLNCTPPGKLQMGDKVEFYAVSEKEYRDLQND